QFNQESSAGHMTIVNNGPSEIHFYNSATGAQARVINNPDGLLDVTGMSQGERFDIGSVENNGHFQVLRIPVHISKTYTQSSTGSLRITAANANPGRIHGTGAA